MARPFRGRLVLAGFGSIGQGVQPLLERHLGLRPAQTTIVSPDSPALREAAEQGCHCEPGRLTEDNHARVLSPWLGPGDVLLNLSVDVDSVPLLQLCRARGALYVDTALEPWPRTGGSSSSPAGRTNHARREAALALGRDRRGPTAVITHGANPGLVSHFVKQALLDLAQRAGQPCSPRTRQDWAALAQALDVRVIHIAERDTQQGPVRKRPGEFVNTWSVRGFVEEACQPAELGWGSHERHFPADGVRHASGSPAAIWLRRPGGATRVRSWTPLTGAMQAFLITHAESLSIADHLTLGDPAEPSYRPTVHYAYHPCDDAVLSLHELAGHEWRIPERQRILRDEITEGADELGVLLMGPRHGAYWYGSRLTISEARTACPRNSATSLQVAAGVMAATVWAIAHPDRGLLEPDELPHDEILALARPYLGLMVGEFSRWTPLVGRGRLFEETLDRDDPWQFVNFRVA